MTPAERDCIRATFRKILPMSDAFGMQFYDHLFRINPPLRTLFPVRLGEQAERLMDALSAMVDALEHPDLLREKFAPIGARHVGYGVRPEYYDDVGTALLLTLQQRLGDDFDREVEAAWAAVYGEMVDAMLGRHVIPAPA